MVKYCEFCGAELEDNASFCDECGKSTGSSVNNSVSSVSTSNQVKSHNLKIISIAVIIIAIVVVGCFALVYFNSGNGLNSNTSTDEGILSSNVETYSLDPGTNFFTINGEGSCKNLGSAGHSPEADYGECIKQEIYEITLPNGDWYDILVYEAISREPFAEPKYLFYPESQEGPSFGYGIDYRLYAVGIFDSNKPDKYMTTDFLKSIIHINN